MKCAKNFLLNECFRAPNVTKDLSKLYVRIISKAERGLCAGWWKVYQQISHGYLNLMCEMAEYTEKEAEQLVNKKNSKIRILKVHNGKMKLSLLDTVIETCDEPIYTLR